MRVPFETVFLSPVTASMYVPLGIFLNVPAFVTATQAKLFSPESGSVYPLLKHISPVTPVTEYCPFCKAGTALLTLLSFISCFESVLSSVSATVPVALYSP